MMTPVLSSLILAEKPKMPGSGEDAYSCLFKSAGDGYIAVFDGCGGMGAKKYAAADGMTGAYIASRSAAFLSDLYYYQKGFWKAEDCAEDYRKFISEGFARVKDNVSDSSGILIKGNMFRELPTTAALAAIESTPNNTIMCRYLWAGDSRGYFLDSEGMCQMTADEFYTDEDAFTNLRSDAKLKNVIHAGAGFQINEKTVQLNTPTAVIVATDGAFGYLLTPMHFEHLLLSTLMEASSENEWQEGIVRALSPVSGDDFALIAALYGFESFNSAKEYFAPRYEELCRDYITPSAGADDDTLLALWNSYKTNYYRR
jgi:serine/threonine protein phosphatase PrpC